MIRCGGHIDRGDGKGWVLDTPGPPAVVPSPADAELVSPPAVAAVDEPAGTDAATDTAEPDGSASEPYAARAECPDCGKDVAVNKDGTLRKHTCLIDAPLPQVTFDSQEGDV